MNVDRRTVWKALRWTAILLLVLVAYRTMRTGQKRLLTSQLQLQECENLAQEIAGLQNRPGFAALGVDSPNTITARAEEALAQAEIPPTALARIEPQSAIRLRDSDYQWRPTRLELRRVSLQEVLIFSHTMIDEAQGTTVRDLRITSFDSDNDAQETDSWNVELVLTQLIYAPLR